MPLERKEERYTYADYLGWNEDERIELIDGEPVMQATPSTAHQNAVLGLGALLKRKLQGTPCHPYIAPLSVRLGAQSDHSDDTVLEPDLFVVCDPAKMTDQGCVGAPDLVIEVLSPSTARTDRVIKFRKYLAAGVREYWMVDPDTGIVQVNVLDRGMYTATAYQSPETIPVQAVPGVSVELGEVFGDS